MTDDEVKAVAEAIYNARPLVQQQTRFVGGTGTSSHSVDIPWSEVCEDAKDDAVCAGVVRDVTEAARAAISKLDEMRGDGWRPIESAPKDGSLFCGWREGKRPALVHWSGWAACWASEGQKLEYPGTEPTHWQPLPTPPTQGTGQ